MSSYYRTAEILEESLRKFPDCGKAVIETWYATLNDALFDEMFDVVDVISMINEIDVYSENHRMILDDFINSLNASN